MNIQVVSAPSILGLKPSGVQLLPEALLKAGLLEQFNIVNQPILVKTLNDLYSAERDPDTHCLNTSPIVEFSNALASCISGVIRNNQFALTLGGDCSILLGITAGLKALGNYGLIFMDAHADFYAPEQSQTGEVADMDLSIITGRGAAMLRNLNGFAPYVLDRNTIHIGQRDEQETRKFGSDDIKNSAITCFDLATIRTRGMAAVMKNIMERITGMNVHGIWIHFDTDVLADDLNPAVDYRLPGGLTFSEIEHIQSTLLRTGKIVGMSISIFNPTLDIDGNIARNLVSSLARSFYSPAE